MFSLEEQTYRFANITVDSSRKLVSRDNEERHLRQKAFQVLVYLLDHRGRLVTKGELFESVWADTAVTDDVLVQCIKEIRRAVGDDTRNPRFIKTVPKSGYRFIAPVNEKPNDARHRDNNVSADLVGQTVEAEPTPGLRNERPLGALRPKFSYLAAASVLFFVVVGLYFAWPSAPESGDVRLPVIEGKKTVAVMFFENQSKSVEFDWLREGLTDMLIAGLSRSDKLTVLSRGQLFLHVDRQNLRNQPISLDSAREIADKTQAQFFVVGGFAQIGNAIRVDTRLHDTETGDLLATESLNVEKAEQLLSLIDMLSLKISNRLGTGPDDKRYITDVMTTSLEAYRYYSLALEKAQGFHSVEAIRLFEKAIDLDPEFVLALARIGYTYAVVSGDVARGKPYLERAFQFASRLTEKDRINIAAWYNIANLDYPGAIRSYRELIERFPLEVEAYSRLARLLRGEERPDEAIEVLRKGLAIDPESKEIYNSLGGTLSFIGKNEEAIAALERYVALAPYETNAYDSLGLAFQRSGNYERAVENYERALQLDPKFGIAIVHLANTLIRLGRYNDAVATFRRYISLALSDNERSRGFDGLAYVFFLKGDLNSASRFAAEVEKLNKEPNWISYFVAAKRGQDKKAGTLEKLLLSKMQFAGRGSRTSKRPEMFYRGTVALNNGRTDEAINYFTQAILHPPPTWHFSDFEDGLANAYLTAGRFDEAISEYQRILAANPNYPLAYFYLGEAYRAKNLEPESRAAYVAFLERWKSADRDIPEIIKAKELTRS